MLQKYWSVTDQTREGAAGGSEWSKQVKSSSITDQILVKGWSKAGQRLVKGWGGPRPRWTRAARRRRAGAGAAPARTAGTPPAGCCRDWFIRDRTGRQSPERCICFRLRKPITNPRTYGGYAPRVAAVPHPRVTPLCRALARRRHAMGIRRATFRTCCLTRRRCRGPRRPRAPRTRWFRTARRWWGLLGRAARAPGGRSMLHPAAQVG